MKEYPKTYESVFTSEKAMKSCDLSKIIIKGDMPLIEYKDLFKGFLKEAYLGMWLTCIKIAWLYKNFTYGGKSLKRAYGNHMYLDRALGVFIRQYVGIDVKPITRSYFFCKLASYFDGYYEDFQTNNPFTNPELYLFPYENISIDYLLVVYQMPDRLDLLAKAEKDGLNFNQFLDYVLNHISCANEEEGKQVYDFMMVRATPPYVRYNLKKKKNGRKRK